MPATRTPKLQDLKPLKLSGRDIKWERGLCNLDNADAFHTDDGKSEHKLSEAEAAKQLCLTGRQGQPCPIIHDCLAYAVVNNIWFGIYGGLTTRERRKLISESKRQKEGAA